MVRSSLPGTNQSARYRPNWGSSKAIEVLIWFVPASIIAALGTFVWQSTHQLDPYLKVQASHQPVRVQVVAQDQKWLFLYPGEGIASVNELAFIAGRPLSRQITSNSVMNSFFIPALESQINAMPGMTTELNLIACAPVRIAVV